MRRARTGLVILRRDLVVAGLKLLVFAFVFAIAVVTLLAVIGHATGLVRSFLVAMVAGTAGVLALSTEKTGTMVGVLISVTTVAGDLALGLAVWEPSEITGSLAQLGAHFAGMILAGSLFLALQRRSWLWVTTHAERWFGQA